MYMIASMSERPRDLVYDRRGMGQDVEAVFIAGDGLRNYRQLIIGSGGTGERTVEDDEFLAIGVRDSVGVISIRDYPVDTTGDVLEVRRRRSRDAWRTMHSNR